MQAGLEPATLYPEEILFYGTSLVDPDGFEPPTLRL